MENEDYRERKRPRNRISGRKALQSRFWEIKRRRGCPWKMRITARGRGQGIGFQAVKLCKADF